MGIVKGRFNEDRVTPSSLPYLERVPQKESDESPLLIMLHGRKAKAETIFSVEGYLDPQFHIISIGGTYQSGPGDFEWFLPYDYDHPLESFSERHFLESERILTDTIKALLQERNIFEDRLFFMGFSQGAAMSYILSLRGRLHPKGVIAMSGFFPRPVMNWDSFPASARYLITHGSDDEVLPVLESIFACNFLESKGISCDYYEYKGRHKMTPAVLERVNQWIRSQIAPE